MVEQYYFVLGSNIYGEQLFPKASSIALNKKIKILEFIFVFIKIIDKIALTAYLLKHIL